MKRNKDNLLSSGLRKACITTAVLLAISLVLFGCKNPADSGDDDPGKLGFSVSGEFTKSAAAGGGTAQFDLKSNAVSKSVGADSYTISGILKDGDMTINLSGSYNPQDGSWSVSAKSSQIVYTLDGLIVDGVSQGTTATIAVKDGDEWPTFTFIVNETNVSVPAEANTENESGGIPSFAQGWWHASESVEGYKFDINVLLSAFTVKGTVVITNPDKTKSTDNLSETIIEVADKGSSVYDITYVYPMYDIDSDKFADAVEEYLGTTGVAAVSDSDYMNQDFPSSGKWVYADPSGNSYSYGGFSADQYKKLDSFFAQNYYQTWAVENGVPQSNRYGKARIEFKKNNSEFTMVSLVKVIDGPYEDGYYYCEFDFASLADLNTANSSLVTDPNPDSSSTFKR